MQNDFKFKVNLGGMIDILSNHLYSSPDVFVRELMQNGVDAISARQTADKDFPENGGLITVEIDEGKTIRFTDNGTGLTEEEIHRFLAVIGQSSKRDIEEGMINADYIGRFGIGLLSCFMVTDEILIRTRSFRQPNSCIEWHGRPDGTYTIRPALRECDIGTEIVIKAKQGAEDYFTEERVSELILYYGLPLPFPVCIKKGDKLTRINTLPTVSGSTRESVMQLGTALFGENFIDFIPLESKSGLFSGAAYILPYSVAATAEQKHRIYLKSMLLTEDGKSILPKWAFFVRCFFNTAKLRPTASREDFYDDDNLKTARKELGECISKYLMRISRTNPPLLKRIVTVHSLAVKSIAAEDDELFNVFMPHLTFETSLGEMTGSEIRSFSGRISYTPELDRFRQLSSIFRAQGELLVNAGYVYETALIRKLSEKNAFADIKEVEDSDIEGILSEPEGVDRDTVRRFEQAANDAVSDGEIFCALKSFSPEQLPALFVTDENARILRDIKRSKAAGLDIFSEMLDAFSEEFEGLGHSNLYFNANNPLVKKLISTNREDKLKAAAAVLYVQSLLSGGHPVKAREMELLNNGLLMLLD
ncbi:MAG: HSP90 family protein [Ruminococcus sp.]|nr:HSP90 family protein [Ruminococcus sp.]